MVLYLWGLPKSMLQLCLGGGVILGTPPDMVLLRNRMGNSMLVAQELSNYPAKKEEHEPL